MQEPNDIPRGTDRGEAMFDQVNKLQKLKGAIIIFLAIALTALCCLWPNFHPERLIFDKYNWQVDVLMHSSYYFFLTMVLWKLILKQTHLFFLFTGLSAFSVVIELLQAFVPMRSVDLMDILSNALGISVGLAIVCLAGIKQRHPGSGNN